MDGTVDMPSTDYYRMVKKIYCRSLMIKKIFF